MFGHDPHSLAACDFKIEQAVQSRVITVLGIKFNLRDGRVDRFLDSAPSFGNFLVGDRGDGGVAALIQFHGRRCGAELSALNLVVGNDIHSAHGGEGSAAEGEGGGDVGGAGGFRGGDLTVFVNLDDCRIGGLVRYQITECLRLYAQTEGFGSALLNGNVIGREGQGIDAVLDDAQVIISCGHVSIFTQQDGFHVVGNAGFQFQQHFGLGAGHGVDELVTSGHPDLDIAGGFQHIGAVFCRGEGRQIIFLTVLGYGIVLAQ